MQLDCNNIFAYCNLWRLGRVLRDGCHEPLETGELQGGEKSQ